MNSFDIRQKFLNFFQKNGHTIVSSSSLIPAADPTLLFTNAGMNQFKDLFLGNEKRDYKRASTIQKCVRAGGKHNDLDEVGFTNRHLTFFEMMGNFSFGDYFKKDAIEFAWNFLTKEIELPKERLVITIYKDDDEALNLWNKNIGVPIEKIIKLGEKENFWQMGDTGPCGPCTEIHIDFGKDTGCKSPNCDPSCSCGRFVEIWNLVFMQFDRQTSGELVPLKKPGVDTGMGLERLCMILQEKDSVFQTDLFESLIKKIEEISKKTYAQCDKNTKAAFHVICDHARSSSLLIADGALPSNEGRGYVLRKIIRRAALFAQKLSDNPKLFTCVANEFICFMSVIYPELKINRDLILKLLESEVEKFASNLIQGQNILEKYMQENLKTNKNCLSGEQIFKLYDTYGFPPEITRVIALENNFSLDLKGFESEMEKQQLQSGKKSCEKELTIKIPDNISTKFVGYENIELETKITFVEKQDCQLWISTEQSPFYIECGGQISDNGWIIINNHTYPILSFHKSDKTADPAILIKISLEDTPDSQIKIGQTVKCVVDYLKRVNTAKNHTSAHLLQATLTKILGSHIKQAGSFVDDKYLRFDFSHLSALTKEQIEEIETLVNQKIQENIKLNIFYTTLEKAKEAGVTASFGEKYNPAQVRVVQVTGFSAELCGGTHVNSTGDIGCFKIESEESLSSGVRRIIAISGPVAIKTFQQDAQIIKNLNEHFKIKSEKIIETISKQQENLNTALSEIKQLKKKLWLTQIPTWQKQIKTIKNIPFLFLTLEDIKGDEIKEICLSIEKTTPGFYFALIKNSATPNQINYLGFVSQNFQTQINLKELNNVLKETFEFKGGGNLNMIQGSAEKFPADLENTIINWIK